jgi:cytochrome b pre-mRNA-processing protein 3
MGNEGTPPDTGGDDKNIFAKELAPPPSLWMRKGTWLGLVFVAMVGVFVWLQGGEDRALSAMSPSQREALFTETLDEFRVLCLADGGGSRWPKKCNRHADFLVRFSECDDTCRREVDPFLTKPTR